MTHALPRLALGLLTACCVGWAAAPAQAQTPGMAGGGLEGWGLVEVRVPWQTLRPGLWPQSFRLINDFRHAPRVDGLQQALARGGPIWDFGPHLSVAANATAGMEQTRLGGYQSEYRLELEPTFRQRFGPLGLTQRGRAEARFFPNETRARFRAQLRATWHGPWAASPFVSEEAFFEPTAGGFNQNRLQTGLSWPVRPDARLDVGYLWRPRLTAEGWTHDHALMFTLFFAPDVRPFLDDEASGS